MSVLETLGKDPNGWKLVFKEMADLVHVVAELGPSITSDDDLLKLITIPVPVLFGGKAAMKQVLMNDLDMTENETDLLSDVSLTPFFFQKMYQEYQEMNNGGSYMEKAFDDVELFCNDSLRERGFLIQNNASENFDLCKITYYDLLLISGNFNSTILQDRIIEYFLNSLPASELSNEYKTTAKQTKVKNSISKLSKLPYFDFNPFFGSEEELIDAIFCGNFFDSLTHQSGGPTRKANEMLQDFQRQVQEFVMKLTPGQTHDDHGIKKCGNIVVNKSEFCF